jgi:hypothetical protein
MSVIFIGKIRRGIMAEDKFNAEGYYDPTAYEALKRIRLTGQICYTCVFRWSCAFAGQQIGMCGSFREAGEKHEACDSSR